jgi:hypothetical protein
MYPSKHVLANLLALRPYIFNRLQFQDGWEKEVRDAQTNIRIAIDEGLNDETPCGPVSEPQHLSIGRDVVPERIPCILTVSRDHIGVQLDILTALGEHPFNEIIYLTLGE